MRETLWVKLKTERRMMINERKKEKTKWNEWVSGYQRRKDKDLAHHSWRDEIVINDKQPNRQYQIWSLHDEQKLIETADHSFLWEWMDFSSSSSWSVRQTSNESQRKNVFNVFRNDIKESNRRDFFSFLCCWCCPSSSCYESLISFSFPSFSCPF